MGCPHRLHVITRAFCDLICVYMCRVRHIILNVLARIREDINLIQKQLQGSTNHGVRLWRRVTPARPNGFFVRSWHACHCLDLFLSFTNSTGRVQTSVSRPKVWHDAELKQIQLHNKSKASTDAEALEQRFCDTWDAFCLRHLPFTRVFCLRVRTIQELPLLLRHSDR